MKCKHCGAENFRASGPCRVCGKPLVELTTMIQGKSSTGFSGALTVPMSTEEIARRFKMRYEHEKDTNLKTLEGVQGLLAMLRNPELNVHELTLKAAQYMHQQFRLRWVAIGLKGSDGAFRYDALVGFREDVAAKRKEQSFRRSDFTENSQYKGWPISSQTRLYLEEDKPYAEGAEATFNRPMLMKSRRRSPEDSLEADYIDVHIYGLADDLLGWIETSGTIAGKLPDTATLRWMETVGSVLGAALMRKKVY